jgi:GAF domain-containing protein
MVSSADVSHSDRSSPDLLQTFTALQSLLLTAQGIDDFLVQVAKLATGVAEPSVSCGITIRRQGQPLTVASSDGRAELLDETQYGAGAGPCLDALHSGAVVDVPELTADTRWSDYRHHAVDQGVRSSLSVPLTVDGCTVGALNLYGMHPHTFDQAARQHAETFATQAATALAIALRAAAQADDTAQLEQALASRTVIDQALGILMAQQRCNADDAFAVLRAHSQNNNRKLRDVAATLISRVTGQAPVPGPGFDRRQPLRGASSRREPGATGSGAEHGAQAGHDPGCLEGSDRCPKGGASRDRSPPARHRP